MMVSYFFMLLFSYYGVSVLYYYMFIILLCLNFFFQSPNYISTNFIFDSLSFFLLFLTFIMGIYMLLSSFNYKYSMNNYSWYLITIMVLLFFICLSFLVNSFFYFYLLFEFSIIPMFFLISGWGYSMYRFEAGMYMLMYTLISSLPFLYYLLYFSCYSLNFIYMHLLFFNSLYMGNIWWGLFLLVFLVKLPIYFLHLWLPKAHVDAPLVGSMVLAGVLLKLGAYGILKMMLLNHLDFFFIGNYLISISFIGSMLVSFLCMRQVDMKSLIAYSSIVHMGLIVLSIYSNSYLSLLGAIFMLISHGICSSCMFYALNIFYISFNSRSLLMMRGGLIMSPIITYWWLLISISNMGFPPFWGFISELLIIIGSMSLNLSILIFMGMLLMFSGMYSIFFFVIFNHGKMKFINKMMSLDICNNLVFLLHFFPLMSFFIMMFYFM
uniref:NADH-ubiquinone oxidoreductase chain 4 n=1 Tax=Riccardoella tokyoensis TaxID=2073164 RepID=A0A7R7Z5S4_9ACAR|nr:NADH dehydrogenase subunit 4 [Riccardoella tokyoensis]